MGGFLMKAFNIMLRSINDVKDFVNIVNKYDFDVDLTSGRYVVDAKSIMGIFSLDLSKPIKVEVQLDDCNDFCNELKNFII
jgi:phosphocarrier protein HPr